MSDEVVTMITQEHGEIVADASALPRCEGCGKPEGSFACKIRHLQMNTGFAKAYEDFKR